jgi:asparagine synthase (glutamine-hydrolysing)
MCGILSILNLKNTDINSSVKKAISLGNSRGPEMTKVLIKNEVQFIFHRLSINGLNDQSMQPIELFDCVLICNGEIYNYQELYSLLNIKPTTQSDCEIIIHLYRKFGIQKTLKMIDGEFAFILLDQSVKFCEEEDKIFFARDIFGTRPLFFGEDPISKLIVFASEIKPINELSLTACQIKPGTYGYLNKSLKVLSKWEINFKQQNYFNIPFYNSTFNNINDTTVNSYCKVIYNNLYNSVYSRVIGTSERPIGCLLSGGLDSSLVAALTAQIYKQPLHTFSIGMPGSLDLKNAKIVAKHINSIHHEIILSPDDFFNAIEEVICKIESYDTTTVRASVGNYLISKYISQNNNAKVILNGDGSDEVTGGYIYFLNSPSDLMFDMECRKLLDNIHYFDVLRSDRSISSNGLEARTPFLDKTFVLHYFSIPAILRNPRSKFNMTSNIWDNLSEKFIHEGMNEIGDFIKSRPEKLLLRYAIYLNAPNLLPPSILWRGKEAFSDGVSGDSGSWFEIIHKKLDNYNISNEYKYLPPKTNEQYYYRDIFSKYYKPSEKCIPYFWMPNFIEASDSSARTLNIYTKR